MRDAEIVYDNATVKLAADHQAMAKLVELSERVKLMRDWEEKQDSQDHLERSLEQAYRSLCAKCGKHRASEIVRMLIEKTF